MSNCFNPANILLPNDCIDMEKWSVIACDQFTSQAVYWDAVEKYVGDAPSTLNVVFPEIDVILAVLLFVHISQMEP